MHLDVPDGAYICCAYNFIEKEFGCLDALINDAAVGTGDSDFYTNFRVIMDTNGIGPAVIANVFRPLLLRS